MKHMILVASAALLVCAAGAASAQTQLVINGSFEAGAATTGWLVSGACASGAVTSGNALSGNGTPSPAGPTDDTRYAQLYPQAANQTCYLYQDIVIPAGQTATLSVDASAGFNPTGRTAQHIGAFRVMTPANAVLLTPFVQNGTQPAAPNLATFTANLTPYAGQTVRLAFEMTNTGCCNVTYGDRVSVLATAPAAPVPTMSEWAMILFGLILAGGATVVIQRRRLDGQQGSVRL